MGAGSRTVDIRRISQGLSLPLRELLDSVSIVPSNNSFIIFVLNNQTHILVKSKPSAVLG